MTRLSFRSTGSSQRPTPPAAEYASPHGTRIMLSLNRFRRAVVRHWLPNVVEYQTSKAVQLVELNVSACVVDDFQPCTRQGLCKSCRIAQRKKRSRAPQTMSAGRVKCAKRSAASGVCLAEIPFSTARRSARTALSLRGTNHSPSNSSSGADSGAGQVAVHRYRMSPHRQVRNDTPHVSSEQPNQRLPHGAVDE